jgi:transposase InsO family protein/transposase-like protein
MGTTKRRSYTMEQREAALATVRRKGVCAAAVEHGVPESCVSRWAKDAGVHRESGPPPSQPVAPADDTTKAAQASRTEVDARPHQVPMAPSAPVPALEPPADAKRPRRTVAARAPSQGSQRPPEAPVTPPAPVPAPVAEAKPSRRTLRSRVAKIYTPSQKAVILEAAGTDGVTAAADKHDVSRFSIYAWQRKVKKAAAGQGPSPTSGPSPQEIEDKRDAEILGEWKTHPGLGPSQIVNQLARRNVRVSVNTVRMVMEDAGYRPPKVEREKHDRCYEAVRPNHLWHLDFVQRYIGKASTFTLILIDDCSRYVVGHGVDDAERADMVLHTFEEAVTQHGRPERVMHDKGSAFWSWRGISRFTELLVEMGIDQIVAEHKEWNGKVEVFNANLHKELFDAYRFYDVAEMRRRLATHLSFYNHGRTHHALGGLLVPADRYYGRAAEVLARIEAGAGRELGDGIELRDRCLELFRVTSRGGVPEVWLLGQKLLGPQG